MADVVELQVDPCEAFNEEEKKMEKKHIYIFTF